MAKATTRKTKTSKKVSAPSETARGETRHVIFIDIVRYSRRKKTKSQRKVVEAFTSILKQTGQALFLNKKRMRVLPTGDGAAICIKPISKLPLVPFNFVCKFAELVDDWNQKQLYKNGITDNARTAYYADRYSDDLYAFDFYIGVTHGTLTPYEDYNGKENFAGHAINEAARLMSFAGPNQVIFSTEAKKAVAHTEDPRVNFLEPPIKKIIKHRPYEGWQLVGPKGIDTTRIEHETPEPRPDEGMDDLPHIWIRTNHSDPRIVWHSLGKDEKKFAKVVQVARENYPEHVKDPGEVECLGNAADSSVYHVADRDGNKKPILLKFHRRFTTDTQLRTLTSIYQHVAEAEIFGNYSQFLEPLHSKNKSDPWVLITTNDNEKESVIAYQFLREAKAIFSTPKNTPVTHFAGNTLKEIKNTAKKLSELNNLLMNNSLTPNEGIFFKRGTTERNDWEEIVKALKNKATNDAFMPKRTVYLALKELSLIKNTFAEIKDLDGEGPREITLNDLHPHNVFVSGDECVLIIDYEGVRNDWPEVATCAFALHRLCREYVRPRIRQNPKQVSNAVSEAADAFLQGYGEPRPDTNVAEVVRREGIRWAKAVNFAKLMGNIGPEMGLTEDLEQRPEEVHYRETIKFLTYLRELEIFAGVMSSAE